MLLVQAMCGLVTFSLARLLHRTVSHFASLVYPVCMSSGLACGVSGQCPRGFGRLDLSPAVCSMPLSYVPTATYRFNLDGYLCLRLYS